MYLYKTWVVYSKNLINLNLLNGLLVIHPIILYGSYCYLITSILKLMKEYTNNLKFKKILLNNFLKKPINKKNISIFFLNSFIAILLGCW